MAYKIAYFWEIDYFQTIGNFRKIGDFWEIGYFQKMAYVHKIAYFREITSWENWRMHAFLAAEVVTECWSRGKKGSRAQHMKTMLLVGTQVREYGSFHKMIVPAS